jgi:hypothetical protein
LARNWSKGAAKEREETLRRRKLQITNPSLGTEYKLLPWDTVTDASQYRLTVNEKFLEVQKPFFKKVSGRRRQKVLIEFYMSSGWAGRRFLSSFFSSAHPVDKNMVLVDPHGGHKFF